MQEIDVIIPVYKPGAEFFWELSILSIAVRPGNRYNRYDLFRRRSGLLPGIFMISRCME